MLYFGIMSFGFITLEHDTDKHVALIERLDKVINTKGMSREQIDALIEEHQTDGYVDTDEFEGMVIYTGEAYENKPVQYGVNEDTKTITDVWTLVDMQDLHADDEIPDDVMWGFMLRCWHKNGTVDDEYIKDCVWEYQTKKTKALSA